MRPRFDELPAQKPAAPSQEEIIRAPSVLGLAAHTLLRPPLRVPMPGVERGGFPRRPRSLAPRKRPQGWKKSPRSRLAGAAVFSDIPPLRSWHRQAQLAPTENSQVPGSSQIICTQNRKKKKEKGERGKKIAFQLRQLLREGGGSSQSLCFLRLLTPSTPSRRSPQPDVTETRTGHPTAWTGGSSGPIPGSGKIPRKAWSLPRRPGGGPCSLLSPAAGRGCGQAWRSSGPRGVTGRRSRLIDAKAGISSSIRKMRDFYIF